MKNYNIGEKKKSALLFLVFVAIPFLLIGQNMNHTASIDNIQAKNLISNGAFQSGSELNTIGEFGILANFTKAAPLQVLHLSNITGSSILVTDGQGKEYVRKKVGTTAKFVVGGALGYHTVHILDIHGKVLEKSSFKVDAKTNVDDGGEYQLMFKLFHHGMRQFADNGMGQLDFKGTTYHYFVHWGLDHYHTMKGMQYFEGVGHEFIDLFRQAQRENGMIMSNVRRFKHPSYFETAYGPKFTDRYEKDVVFVRQPTENHCEYIYALIFYKGWKATGDDDYLKRNITSVARALDYSITDELRWSTKYQLLKRPYTIDSWDFQLVDEHTPNLGAGTDMMIDKDKTKFGVFFGDNTGYALACERLAELYQHIGDDNNAIKYRRRAEKIRKTLNELSWNGQFFTHFIDEDESLKRDLGVDEKSQISHSNMYSTNRNLRHDQNVAIINTYMNLKENLPQGSPAEWYAIYPPFQKGFAKHNPVWQYMNGGIAGHGAGELAKGAYENGFEKYATNILDRLFKLVIDNDNNISFAYTGAYPSPEQAEFRPLDLSPYANMSLTAPGAKGSTSWMLENEGNDMRNLPVGKQNFGTIGFQVVEPEVNNGNTAISVASSDHFPDEIQIPINETAACVYLLHASNRVGKENVCGAIIFNYQDGTKETQYIIKGKHLGTWWFPEVNSKYAGVAWRGPNHESLDVGVYWAAIDNPRPNKIIDHIAIHSSLDESIYSVMGMTLSNQKHYVKPPMASYGGPDNWAAGTAMAALIEGLCGVQDKAVKFNDPLIAPRWASTSTDSVAVTVRYEASDGYVSYKLQHREDQKSFELEYTGSGNKVTFHFLLPENVMAAKTVVLNGKEITFENTKMELSNYVDFTVNSMVPGKLTIHY